MSLANRAAPASEGVGEIDAADPAAAQRAAPLHIERVGRHALVGLQSAWAELSGRVLEANVFLEPAFALPLVQHIKADSRPDFLLAWEENGPTSFGRLVGLLPLTIPRHALVPIANGFGSKQVALGTPLLDRDRGAEALGAMLAWLGATYPRLTSLRLVTIDRNGPFHAILRNLCAADGRGLLVFEERERAVLRASSMRGGMVTCLTSAKRRKEMLRKRRRLGEKGLRAYTSARSPNEVARATERFLALEHNGWKGERGTALLSQPPLATFTRSMTRLMAYEGKCRIDSIEIDGVPIAMGIILTVGARAHFWKTAFDETYAPLSPGVQFALELTQAQLADAHVALTDSCAVPDHPMINRLWPDRMSLVDLLIDLQPDRGGNLVRAACFERLHRWALARLKALAAVVRHRRTH